MENNEVQDVRVVQTVPNYEQALKLAVLTGVATVVVTATTEYVLKRLAASAKNRKNKNAKTSDS